MLEVTYDNIPQLDLKSNEENLLKSLLDDVAEINEFDVVKVFNTQLEILWQDYHDDFVEYPDMYGTFRIAIKQVWEKTHETLSLELSLDELDTCLCSLFEYNEQFNNIYKASKSDGKIEDL